MGDDTIKKNISKNIAKYRESAGLSQKELANKLGVVPSRISNWETGANCPTIDILFEVCEVLGVSFNDIYGVYPDSKFVLKYGEQDLLKKYRTLDSHGKKIVDFVLTEEADRCSCESTCTLSVEEQCAAVARDIRKYIGQIDVHDPDAGRKLEALIRGDHPESKQIG